MSYFAIGGIIVGGVVGAGGAMLAGKPETAQPQQFHPQAFNLDKSLGNWQDIIKNNWGDATATATRTNSFNLKESLKQYTTMQPQFQNIQNIVGTNALSFAKGQLPSDVVSNIGRAAASQGIQGGYAGGDHTGTSFTANGAPASLDLRNLGVSSLDLAQMGTNMGMQVNAQAKALSPVLSSPMDFLPNVNTALSIGQQNNNDANSASLSNLAAMNRYHQDQMNADYAYRMSMINGAMSGMKSGSSIGGAMGGMGGGTPAVGAPGAYEGQMNGMPVMRAGVA